MAMCYDEATYEGLFIKMILPEYPILDRVFSRVSLQLETGHSWCSKTVDPKSGIIYVVGTIQDEFEWCVYTRSHVEINKFVRSVFFFDWRVWSNKERPSSPTNTTTPPRSLYSFSNGKHHERVKPAPLCAVTPGGTQQSCECIPVQVSGTVEPTPVVRSLRTAMLVKLM